MSAPHRQRVADSEALVGASAVRQSEGVVCHAPLHSVVRAEELLARGRGVVPRGGNQSAKPVLSEVPRGVEARTDQPKARNAFLCLKLFNVVKQPLDEVAHDEAGAQIRIRRTKLVRVHHFAVVQHLIVLNEVKKIAFIVIDAGVKSANNL